MAGDSYRHLTIAQKQAASLARAREPAVTCPACETQTTAADLLAHVESRCTGERPAPPQHSKWITWPEARALGVRPFWLTRWVQRGHVRMVGERRARRYLLRDIAVRVARRRL